MIAGHPAAYWYDGSVDSGQCSTIELLNLVAIKFYLVLCRQLFGNSLNFLLQYSPKQSCSQHVKFSLSM